MPSAQSVQKEGPENGHPWKSHKRLKHNSAPSLDFLVRGAASDLTIDGHTKNILFGSYPNRTACPQRQKFRGHLGADGDYHWDFSDLALPVVVSFLERPCSANFSAIDGWQ
jgi:hypothetical protein